MTITGNYQCSTLWAGVLLVCGALTGCDSRNEWSSGKYSVYAIDGSQNRTLGRKLGEGNYIGRVGPTVVAVGEDEKWIVAKRRTPDGREWFYYFKKSADDDFKNGEDIAEGPFDEPEFERRRSQYGLPALQKTF